MLIIDPKTRMIKDAIDTEGTGHWLAVLPNGRKAYVENKNDKPFVTVIDLSTWMWLGTYRCRTGRRALPRHRTANVGWRWIIRIPCCM